MKVATIFSLYHVKVAAIIKRAAKIRIEIGQMWESGSIANSRRRQRGSGGRAASAGRFFVLLTWSCDQIRPVPLRGVAFCSWKS